MTERSEQSGSVQSVDRALQILSLLADTDALGVSEISRKLGVHRSTAFRLLATLESHNFVEQEVKRGTYRLGFGVLRLSGRVEARTGLVHEGQVVCDAVRSDLNDTSNLAILDQDAAVNIVQATGTRLVSVTQQFIGQRTPLHATSTGKVLLAHAAPDALRAVLAGPLERFTARTITDPSALAAHLEEVRSQGWAAAVGEWEADANAVAVPVRDRTNAVVAALSVTAPSFRLVPEGFPEVVEALRGHSLHLSARLGALRATQDEE